MAKLLAGKMSRGKYLSLPESRKKRQWHVSRSLTVKDQQRGSHPPHLPIRSKQRHRQSYVTLLSANEAVDWIVSVIAIGALAMGLWIAFALLMRIS